MNEYESNKYAVPYMCMYVCMYVKRISTIVESDL